MLSSGETLEATVQRHSPRLRVQVPSSELISSSSFSSTRAAELRGLDGGSSDWMAL